MMLDLSHIDLLRLRRTEAESISRWLNDEEALKDFKRAIRLKLRKFARITQDNAEVIYIFGREMRKIFDERANSEISTVFTFDDLPPEIQNVFSAGFLKWTYEDLLELVATTTQSKLG